jgi:hypothetical protein
MKHKCESCIREATCSTNDGFTIGEENGTYYIIECDKYLLLSDPYKMKCDDCLFYHSANVSDGVGPHCCRNAPVICADGRIRLPVIYSSDEFFCGEFKPKPTKEKK